MAKTSDRILHDGNIVLTKEVAYACGWDAGTRNAHKHGRSAWNAEDADIAARETLRLMVAGGHMTLEMASRCGYEPASAVVA